MKIIRNSAHCPLCNEEIVSRYRHDFVRCTCGNVFVDGGNNYLRRGYYKAEPIDTSITEEDGEPGRPRYK